MSTLRFYLGVLAWLVLGPLAFAIVTRWAVFCFQLVSP